MKLPKYLTTVTPFSKTLAMFLFIVFPFIGFYLGVQYQKNILPPVYQVNSIPITTTAANSGIEGKIVLSPTCPVQRIGENCTKPYQATVLVESADQSKKILSFMSDKNGNFKASLPPGTYYLKPISSGVFPRGISQTVTVKDNAFTNTIINYDTGIR